MSFGLREGIIVSAALASVTLLILVWALFFRARHRRRSLRHSGQRSRTADVPGAGPLNPGRLKRRKWRRHRSDSLPRNPTLAETGGLPPARTQAPPDPPP